MKAKITIALILAAGVLAATLAVLHPPSQTLISAPQQPDTALSSAPLESPQPETPKPVAAPRLPAPPETETTVLPAQADPPAAAANKLERLTQSRESFRALAAADPTAALRAAKQITNETERETALLTLATEWTQGNLRSPQQRAQAIAAYGLEAGLGMELAQKPELASLWANELTDSSGRTALLGATAIALVGSDPAAAFALSDQIPQTDRRNFIRQMFPGTPSELSGQLHPGDRILALAQGDNSFVDAHSLSLQDIVQMIRGAPGTLLQLQVLSADAPPNSLPRTVPIIRDQIKFKQ